MTGAATSVLSCTADSQVYSRENIYTYRFSRRYDRLHGPTSSSDPVEGFGLWTMFLLYFVVAVFYVYRSFFFFNYCMLKKILKIQELKKKGDFKTEAPQKTP